MSSNSYCESKLSALTHTAVWKIDKFRIRPKSVGTYWSSSPFEIKGFDDVITKWEIRLYPTGDTAAADGFVSLKLQNLSISGDVKLFYEMYILGINGDKFNHYVCDSSGAYSFSPGSRGPKKFINLNEKLNQQNCLVDDSLTIVCEIYLTGIDKKISDDNEHVAVKVAIAEDSQCLTSLRDDLTKAFNNNDKESSDVTIKCDGKEFYCHQFMLTARSPVFEAMFQSKMMEQQTRSIDIDDFTSDVVENMLIFIYSGTTPNVDQKAKELLNIADKYQLQQLKNSLGEKLVSILDNDNCFENLALGDLFRVDGLKKTALTFLKRNSKKILKKENWKEGLENLPSSLAWEVMEEIVKN